MLKQEIYTLVNNFTPYHTAEDWDCSGWIVNNSSNDVNKALLCLTVTDDVYNQADAEGFINLFGLPLKINALMKEKAGK